MRKIKKGFTLIELIVVIALMAMIGIIISNTLSSTIKINNNINDKLDLEQNLTNIQRFMYNDIRKANLIVDSQLDTTLNRVTLNGSNMDQNNAYCRLKDYKPLIYLQSIMGDRAFYAYDKVNGQVRKIIIPNDSTTTTVIKYFTASLQYDNTTKDTQWAVIPSNQVAAYTPPTMTYDITDEVITKGLTINYDSTNDGVDNAVTFNNFTTIGAFIKKDSTGKEINRYVVLKSNIQDVDGTYPWFIIPIKAETLVYYTNTIDKLVGQYIVPNGALDGIVLSHEDASNNGELTGYYDIQLYGKKNGKVTQLSFRVSTVDYGGDIQ